MNSFVAFIVKDLLGQASILIAFIAMLGLILQKKSPGKTAEGTFKNACSVFNCDGRDKHHCRHADLPE